MVLLPFSVDNTQTVVVHILPLWLTYKSKYETRVVHVLLWLKILGDSKRHQVHSVQIRMGSTIICQGIYLCFQLIFLCQHRSSTYTPLILAHYISKLHLPVQLIVPTSMCAPHSGELTFNYKSKFWSRVVRVLIWIRSCAIRFEITVRSIIC